MNTHTAYTQLGTKNDQAARDYLNAHAPYCVVILMSGLPAAIASSHATEEEANTARDTAVATDTVNTYTVMPSANYVITPKPREGSPDRAILLGADGERHTFPNRADAEKVLADYPTAYPLDRATKAAPAARQYLAWLDSSK